MLKTLRIKEDTHRALKEYCEEKNQKIVGTSDLLIMEGLRVFKRKQAEMELYK